MKKLLRTVCLSLACAAAMSCSYPTPTPISVREGPPARMEWLLGPGALLNAVHLTESGVGAAVGEQGAILVTSDAGVTWTAVESGTDRSLKGVAFADAMNGVAVGAGGTVLRTADGGRSWTAIGTGLGSELRGVAFGGPEAAIIVGEGGAILRSVDAGRVWQPVVRATASTLRAVKFVTPSIAVAAGDDGTLLRSTDGGVSWATVDSGTSAALRGLHFTGATIGIAVGGDDRRWRSERVVLRTMDGGATWAEIDAPKGTRLYSVTAASDGSIVAVGEAGASIRSADEGITWEAAKAVTQTSMPNTPDFRWDTSNAFASVSPAGGALVAVTYGGRILRSEDGGSAWSPVQQMPDMPVASFLNSPIARAGDDALVIGAGNFIFRSEAGTEFEKTTSAGDQIVFGIRFLDPLVGVSVGVAGRIQRTVDGGKTWTTVESGTKRNIRRAAFGDDKNGVAVAGPAGTGPGMVRSEDGGLTWQAQPCVGGTKICESSSAIAGVDMLPSQVGMAVGVNGVVIKTTDGGRSWVQLNHGLKTSTLWDVALIDDNTA
ncbi:MAG: WD40/YVTN/BNR-like repeat-containing protein, partial [Pyrinomonadaceae bacterium]